MKREMDLVRQILITSAESTESVDADVFVSDRYDFEMVAYTIDIMEEAGLINANVQKAFGGDYISAQVKSLTWKGQDFLDSVKSNKVWTEVKSTIAKGTGAFTFEIIKKIAEKIIEGMVL